MAKRPDNHIVGDNAVRMISSALIPEEWTISIPDSDYGLDMLVEVVIDNATTGKFFFIQSKGTEDSSCKGVISYAMSVERIKDYHRISIPVLFVYYSKAENKFWGRWMNGFCKSLSPRQLQQKTVTLEFTSRNLIDVDYLRSIGPGLVDSITSRVSLLYDNSSDAFRRFHNKLFSISQYCLGEDITGDSHLTCETIKLSYEGTPLDGYIIVISKGVSARIPICLESYEWLYSPIVTLKGCPDCILDAICIIAFLCSKYSARCLDYVLSGPRRIAMDVISLDRWSDFIEWLPCEIINKVTDLFSIAIQSKHDDIAQLIIIAVFRASIENDSLNVLYREFLFRYLQQEYLDEIKGALYYNLANSMRNVDLHESFSLYKKAIRNDPSYGNRFYWWQEVGGVLYLLGYYLFAELFYMKARRLSKGESREDINLLISDCLICQGKVKRALNEERKFLKKAVKVTSRIKLRMGLTKAMDSRRIIVFDPLKWFNRGIEASRINNHNEALECFLYAWRLNDGDIEALVNAFVSAMNSHDKVADSLILDTIREQAPEEGYNLIVSTILANTNPTKEVDDFLDGLNGFFFPKN